MSTVSLVLEQERPALGAVHTGVALAGNVALFYALCTAVAVVAPGPFLSFVNSLFHGMDFTSLSKPMSFSWGGFIEALLVMSVWGFFAGMFFAWLRHRLNS